jgi:hypothetical protein
MRVSKEPVCIYLFRQNPVFTTLQSASEITCSCRSAYGLIFPSWWKVRQRAGVAILCVFWDPPLPMTLPSSSRDTIPLTMKQIKRLWYNQYVICGYNISTSTKYLRTSIAVLVENWLLNVFYTINKFEDAKSRLTISPQIWRETFYLLSFHFLRGVVFCLLCHSLTTPLKQIKNLGSASHNNCCKATIFSDK